MVSQQNASHDLTKIHISIINTSSSKWVEILFQKLYVMLKLNFKSFLVSCQTKYVTY